ncbi:FtsQ-type POTRA domain-containing protein [Paenibacillus sp. N4]|uniref:cell division protein FtsQ/DivIB n=1 Tax=Paenibacillus vietnamensis TaxID=2590547 RepID=UPI001CD110CE|nr:FtsQ-type POTRA domain-containing protein [Paenibacillus vietnamensis]MCA0753831.1 FtsQ-type POTRA domain-containing protein [Paenibacillus vietnamensis]
MSAQMPVLKEPGRKRVGSSKLLFILLLLFIAILAVLFFNSSISKISEIQIEGNRFSTQEEIEQAAAIVIGDAFFGTTSGMLEDRVSALAPVEKVTVTKVFPGVIKILVQEYPVVAFELSDEGEMTALLSNGTTVDASNDQLMLIDKPVLTGWAANDPLKGELTKQLAQISAKQLSDLSEIIPIPSNAYPDRILIYTRTRFEVITAISVLKEKIDALNAVIETQEPGKITMLLADTYVPFDPEGSENMDSGQKETTQ